METEIFRDKSEAFFKENYNCSNANQVLEFKEKRKNTIIDRYNTLNFMNVPEIYEKMSKTSLERYNTIYPIQNAEIADKALKNSFKSKEIVLPSGIIVKLQGFEPFALNDLLLQYKESDIICGDVKKMPEIWWKDSNDSYHRYYCDFYIPSKNHIIEVKSNWTYEIDIQKITFCRKAIRDLKYNYSCWVYNKKGEKINGFDDFID